MNKLKLFLVILFAAVFSKADHMGIPIQLKLKSPGGTYPTESGVNFTLMVLSPVTNCILREETFSSQNVVDGSVSLALGSGVLGSNDPGFSLVQVYDNSTAKNGLSCVDSNNNVVTSGQSYAPAGGDKRLIRVSTVLMSEPIIVNFNMRSVPYAVQADAVGGKTASEILVRNSSTQLNQNNLNDLLLDASRLSNLLAVATSGSVSSAGGFTGVLAGDVSGAQGSTVVDKIKGVPVSSSAPSVGQVLQFNGSQYVPANMPSAAVTSVAGRTGAVTLSHSDISGLGSGALLDAGSSSGNLVQLDGSGKIPSSYLPAVSSQNLSGDVSGTTAATVVMAIGGKTSFEVATAVSDVQGASSVNSAGTIVKRDSSGNLNANVISSSSNSTFNLYLYDSVNSVRLKAPSGLASSLVLTLPSSTGSSGQFLQTDGAGNLSWATASTASGTVASVTASAPLSSSGGTTPNISLDQASASGAGYLSSADWNTFNNKQAALGFTPLNVTAYNADLSPAASCSSSQTPYWNTVSDTWACQSISYPVTSVAGRTGAVTLVSSDISGLGSAATLNAGSSALNVVQLDGSARIPASTLPANAVTTSTALSGDVTGTVSSVSVDRIRGVPVGTTAPVTGQALVYNGTEWVPTHGVPLFSRKTTNQTLAVTATASITDLSFPVSAGVTYKYKFHIAYTSAATNTGLRVGLTYPAVTVASGKANIASGGDGTAAYAQGVINSSGDSVMSPNSSTTSANGMYSTVEGIIVPSAAGTVQLIGGTEINGNNIVIKAGSFVEYTIVP